MSRIQKYYLFVLKSMGILFLIALVFAFGYRFYRQKCYSIAVEEINSYNYNQAKERFEKLGDYRDCAAYLSLLSAIESIEKGEYEDAVKSLQSLDTFERAAPWLFQANYKYAQQLYDEGSFEQSVNILIKLAKEAASKSEEDFDEWLFKSKLAYAKQLYAQENYLTAIDLFEELGTYEDSHTWLNKSKYALALELRDQNDLNSAISYFLDLGNYERSAQYVDEILDSGIAVDTEALYKAACIHFDTGLYWRALTEFQSLGNYIDSEKYVEEAKKMLRQDLSTTVSVGQSYTVAVDYKGKALTTGFGPNGPSNINDWDDLVSISGFSDITAGLKSDGTVITTSNTINNEIYRTGSSWQAADIVAISVGHAYIVGLDSDGTLKSTGHDQGDGQRDVDDWTNIVAIATGWRHTVGLNSNGDVLITGYGSSRQFNQIQSNKDEWSHIIAIAAGGGNDNNIGKGHTVGLREDGRVVAVGDNSFNQCEVGQWENIIAIAAGDWFTIGLDKDGSVFVTKPSVQTIQEYNLYTDVFSAENWSNTGLVAINAGGGSAIGLYDNGTVVAVGYGR